MAQKPKRNSSKYSDSFLKNAKSSSSDDTITNNAVDIIYSKREVKEIRENNNPKDRKSGLRGFLKRMINGSTSKKRKSPKATSLRRIEYNSDIPLSDEEIRQLIEHFYKYPSLYNPQNSQYGNRKIEEICYDNISAYFPNRSSEELETYVNLLRQQFEREYSIIENARIRYGENLTPSIKFYDEFQFLVPYIDICFESISDSQIGISLSNASLVAMRADDVSSSHATQSAAVKCSSDATRVSDTVRPPVLKISSVASHLSGDIRSTIKNSSLKQKSMKNVIFSPTKSVDFSAISPVPQLACFGKKKKPSDENLPQNQSADNKSNKTDDPEKSETDEDLKDQAINHQQDQQLEQEQAKTARLSDQEQASARDSARASARASARPSAQANVINMKANQKANQQAKSSATGNGNGSAGKQATCPCIRQSNANPPGAPISQKSCQTQVFQDKHLGCVAIIHVGNSQSITPTQSSRNSRISNGSQQGRSGAPLPCQANCTKSLPNRGIAPVQPGYSPQAQINRTPQRANFTPENRHRNVSSPAAKAGVPVTQQSYNSCPNRQSDSCSMSQRMLVQKQGKNDDQVQLLCDMIRVELGSAPDFVYYDAKWRIIEILREVGKRNMINQSGTQQNFAQKANHDKGQSGTLNVSTNKFERLCAACPYCCKTKRSA